MADITKILRRLTASEQHSSWAISLAEVKKNFCQGREELEYKDGSFELPGCATISNYTVVCR